MNETYKPENLLVRRDGEIEHEYYDAIYAAKRREVLGAVGHQVVGVLTRPLHNFRLNILDMLSNEAEQV